MATGELKHLPQAGGIMEQNETLLDCLYAAWRAWHINAFKPSRQIPITPEDGLFMESILPKDYQPESGFNLEAVKELKAAVNG